MLLTPKTFNTHRNNQKKLEKEFNSARLEYLKELKVLRKKYAHRMISILADYNSAAAL